MTRTPARKMPGYRNSLGDDGFLPIIDLRRTPRSGTLFDDEDTKVSDSHKMCFRAKGRLECIDRLNTPCLSFRPSTLGTRVTPPPTTAELIYGRAIIARKQCRTTRLDINVIIRNQLFINKVFTRTLS